MIFPSISLRIERWKFNKEYGVYVSTLGNFKDRYKRRLPIRINQKGYCTVFTEVSHKAIYAHRLVMLTWRPIPNAENLTVDHLNHNKRDNSLYNLEWVTEEENHKRAKQDYVVEIADRMVGPKSVLLSEEQYLDNIEGIWVNQGLAKPNVTAVYNEILAQGISIEYSDIENYVNQLLSRDYKATERRINKRVKLGIKFKNKKLKVVNCNVSSLYCRS